MPERMPSYGGQAVIEGVMMRGKKAVAIAMRSPQKEIIIHRETLGPIYSSRLSKIPFLRGLILLYDALGLGMRALTISANLQTGEDEKLEGPALYGTIAVALAIGIGLFFLFPAVLGQLIEQALNTVLGSIPPPSVTLQTGFTPNLISNVFPAQAISSNPMAAWVGNLAEGIFRLLILIGYLLLIGRMDDIRRVFSYHGAEHKTINAYEANAELTPENVARFPLEHPRCGTSFILTVVLMSVIVFSLLGPLPIEWRLISRVLFIPLLAGFAYEYIRWTAEHINSPIVRFISRPNLALQGLTTREPSLDMLEVSIAAFLAMKADEEKA